MPPKRPPVAVPPREPIRLPPRPRRQLAVPRMEQPDDVTCGPTCLHQVYQFYGDHRPLTQIIDQTRTNPDGGTLAVYLGLTALAHGYRVTLYPQGIRVFDPTWRELSRPALQSRLTARAATRAPGLPRDEVLAWREFLSAGGQVQFQELCPELLVRVLDRDHPVICGLSATYLYRTARERPTDNEEDDIAGEPVGHFVVLCGYTGAGRHFHVRDPSIHSPFSDSGRYVVAANRLTNAILLGDATRDALLLEIWPRVPGAEPPRSRP